MSKPLLPLLARCFQGLLVLTAALLLISAETGCTHSYTPERGAGTADDEDRELEDYEDIYPGN